MNSSEAVLDEISILGLWFISDGLNVSIVLHVLSSLHDISKRWHVLKTSFFGKGACALASPVKAGNHAHFMLVENGSASMPRITRHQIGNAIKGFCFGHWIGLYAGKG